MKAAHTSAQSGGAAAGRFLVLVIVVLGLSACVSSRADTLAFRAPPPPVLSATELAQAPAEDSAATTLTQNQGLEMIAPASGLALATKADGLGMGEKACSIKDRFDRKATLAYDFADNKSRLALKMGLDGLSVSRAMVRFSYKFQPIKSRKERCRFTSPWQGLIGSAYNELHLRKEDTVWQALRAKVKELRNR